MTTGDVVHRHNDLYRHFVAEGRAAMISLSIETPILKSAEDSYRPDIILSRGIPGYSDKPLGLDLTVTCPLNKTLIQTASKQELYAACKAAALKDRLQKDDLDNLGYSFMPLAFETTGGHTEEVTTLVHYIAKEKQLMTGIPFSENVTRLWELLSTTLQRANAFAIKKRYYETLPNTDEVP